MSDDIVDPEPAAAEPAAERPPDGETPVEKKGKDKKPGKAKDSKEKASKGEGKDKGKSKGKGKGKKADGLSVATHPRAGAQVRRAKGWGGLAGFGIAAYLSFRAGVPPEQVGMRALASGAVGYIVAWACTVTIWRHLVLAELRAQYERHQATQGVPVKASLTGPKDDGHAS